MSIAYCNSKISATCTIWDGRCLTHGVRVVVCARCGVSCHQRNGWKLCCVCDPRPVDKFSRIRGRKLAWTEEPDYE